MKMGHPGFRVPIHILAVVLVLVAVLLIAAVLVVILILVVVLAVAVVLVLILVLVHGKSSVICLFCGIAAGVACPFSQLLSLSLKIKLTRSPAIMAAVMPPAQALSPPVKMPRKPSWSTAVRTPLAKV